MAAAARVSRARRLRVEAGVQRRSTALFIGPGGVALVSVAEPGLSRTPGRVLSIDVHKLTVQKIHENINGKIDNIQKAPSRSNIFILLQQLIQVQR